MAFCSLVKLFVRKDTFYLLEVIVFHWRKKLLPAKRGICIVKFDDRLGPGCLYQIGIDRQFAQKVSVKSHISTMALTSSQNTQDEFIESVIPFLDEGYIAYSNYFFIKDSSSRGGRKTIGIVALVDKSEQMSLYKSIPELSTAIKQIAQELIKSNITSDRDITSEIKEQMQKLLKLESLPLDFDSKNDSIQMIKERVLKEEKKHILEADLEDKIISEGSFDFLFSKVPEGLEKVVFALLKNERVLVFGRKQEISLTLATLRWFLPHKKLYNDVWTVPLVDAEALFSRHEDSVTLHVLGIESSVYKDIFQQTSDTPIKQPHSSMETFQTEQPASLPFQSMVIINLDTGEVTGGLSNGFCKQLVQSIKERTFDEVLKKISEQIEYLLERVFDLIILVLDEADKPSFEQFIENAIEGEITLLTAIISDTNPHVFQKLLESFKKHKLPLEILT